MTARYHINPETGKPGLCSAEHQCRFSPADQHHNSEAEARQAYEQSMATKMLPDNRSLREKARQGTEEQRMIKALRDEILQDGLSSSPPRLFHSSEEGQKRFRSTAQDALRRSLGGLQLTMFDRFDSPRGNADARIGQLVNGTDWDDTHASLQAVYEVEKIRLAFIAQAENLNATGKRKERREARTLEKSAEGIEQGLSRVPYEILDREQTSFSREEARARWVNWCRKGENAYDAGVPCDHRQDVRVYKEGFCSKCGGAEIKKPLP